MAFSRLNKASALTLILTLVFIAYLPAILESIQDQEIEMGTNNDIDGLTYLALGDSYTIGEAVEINERWPVQLVHRLEEENINLEQPRIIATTGWTTDELINAIDEEISEPGLDIPYYLVSLLIGVNNQYRGYSIDTYREEVRELMQRAIEYSGNNASQVFVVSIPDWGVTPFASEADPAVVADEIDKFNLVKKEEALKLGLLYIDITEISRTAVNDVSLTASDGLHPSGKMYTLWVDIILPQIRNLIT